MTYCLSVPASVHVETRIALKDFIWTLIRTDFKARYHGAVSGFVWALARPLIIFAVLYTVFSFMFHDSTYMLNLLCGILLWSFFAEGTQAGLESLLRKSFLLTKARLPAWTIVCTAPVNAGLTLLVYCVVIVVTLLITRGQPHPLQLLFFLFYVILYVLMVIGFALGTSVLFVKFRDLNQIWDVCLQAGFFLAPVVYPLDSIPERYHFYFYLWPVTPVLQFSRQVLIRGEIPTLKANLLLVAVTAAIFGSGVLLYRRFLSRAVEQL
jgi:homopolymeric O-antigen transport system permease protein